MLEGKAVICETDMLQTMQEDALDLAAKAIGFFDAADSTDIARFIKKEFDRMHGPGWQCIVGRDFGSFVTHCFGCFICFQIESLSILLFRGSAGYPEPEENQFEALESLETLETMEA
ncbi:hypothetical protein SADUNF_Sadunf16G0270800 [Salix dunnii]|uniref:Dynein light chain n=1 Tax=Salix dunnii TaxID=1413687 RepID=A0A835JDK3_9ROSI|nr:hypothetical protein SADUNF_Sadunf16G0270800 [Salix dunnii]